jgi:hypothetical protein
MSFYVFTQEKLFSDLNLLKEQALLRFLDLWNPARIEGVFWN